MNMPVKVTATILGLLCPFSRVHLPWTCISHCFHYINTKSRAAILALKHMITGCITVLSFTPGSQGFVDVLQRCLATLFCGRLNIIVLPSCMCEESFAPSHTASQWQDWIATPSPLLQPLDENRHYNQEMQNITLHNDHRSIMQFCFFELLHRNWQCFVCPKALL